MSVHHFRMPGYSVFIERLYCKEVILICVQSFYLQAALAVYHRGVIPLIGRTAPAYQTPPRIWLVAPCQQRVATVRTAHYVKSAYGRRNLSFTDTEHAETRNRKIRRGNMDMAVTDITDPLRHG